jgi:hypothetical protein
MTGHLVVHTRRGVLEIPLTGDARTDALLEMWARRGRGRVAVLRERGELALDPSSVTTSRADREAA